MTKLSDADGTTPPDPDTARCPQCDKPLDIVDRSTLVGYACHDCGGIWLDSETSARVRERLDTQTIQVGEIAAGLAEVPFPPHQASPPCPICRVPMQTWTVASTDVEVDSCNEHGTWFDRGELQTLIRELMARITEPASPAFPPVSADDGQPGTYTLSSAELRAQMMMQYGVDPSAPPASPGLGIAQDVATGLAVDIGLSILGSLLGGRR
jgi:Zn-finger nucleic acid-binding protein